MPLVIVIVTVAVPVNTPSNHPTLSKYPDCVSKSKLVLSTTSTALPLIPKIPSPLPDIILYEILSPSASVHDKVTTTKPVAAVSGILRLASSIIGVLSLTFQILIVAVPELEYTPSLPLIPNT